MNLFMIAVIKNGSNIVGYRLLDSDEKPAKTMNVPVDNVIQVIKSGAATVNNIEVQGNSIVGTNGSIERYATVDMSGKLLSKISPLVIINQLGEVGYTVSDYAGRVKKARNTDVVSYAKKQGIANGKVVMKDNIEFISSIAGTYDIEKIAPSKVNNAMNDVNVRIALKNVQQTGRVADNAGIDVSAEIENSDVFESMNRNQQMVVKSYYVWYTVDKYKSLAKNIRFDISTTKAEALAELRGIEDWEFGGVWDSGYMGASKCQLGHSIRYEYYAVPSNDRDNPDAAIVFGENCAADFFHIKPEDMRALVKTREIMSEEIKLMSDILANNQERLYMGKAELLYKICKRLGSRERLNEVFGKKVGDTLAAFIIVKVPFPMSLVLEAGKQSRKNIPQFFNRLFPEYRGALTQIFETDIKDSTYPVLARGARQYLEFIADNKIEGAYAYNPDDKSVMRRDVGGYNKETRYRRYMLLRNIRIRALATQFTFDEMEDLLITITNLMKIRDKAIESIHSINIGQLMKIAQEFAEDASSNREKNLRSNVFNSLTLMQSNRPYNLIYFNSGTGERQFHRDIKYVKESTIKTLEVLDRVVEDFKVVIENVNKETEEMERQEQERRAKLAEMERQEKERKELIEKQRERLEKEREEREKREQERVFNEDKVGKLKALLEANTEIAVDNGIEVAKAIVEKGILYDDLSPKQRWRVDHTLDRLMNTENQENRQEQDNYNKTYSLDENEDIKNKVQGLLDNKDKVKDTDKIAIKIANTIIKSNKATDKQLRYIKRALANMDK